MKIEDQYGYQHIIRRVNGANHCPVGSHDEAKKIWGHVIAKLLARYRRISMVAVYFLHVHLFSTCHAE